MLSEALERIVHTLVTEYQPEKIILFGSMATGDVGEWSDIDLAIIKDTPKRFIERLKGGGSAVPCKGGSGLLCLHAG